MKHNLIIVLLGLCSLCCITTADVIVGDIRNFVFDDTSILGGLDSYVLSDGEGRVAIFFTLTPQSTEIAGIVYGRESMDYGVNWVDLPMVERPTESVFTYNDHKVIHAEFFSNNGIRVFTVLETNWPHTNSWDEISIIEYQSNTTPVVIRQYFEMELFTPFDPPSILPLEGGKHIIYDPQYYSEYVKQFITQDNGVTWNDYSFFPLLTEEGTKTIADVQFSVGDLGAIGAICEEWDSSDDYSGSLQFSISHDQGANWSSTPNIGGSTLNGRNRPQLATSEGVWLSVFYEYPYLPGTNNPHNISMVRSTDNGQNWSLPTPLHINEHLPEEAQDYNMKLVAYNGTFLLVWFSNSVVSGDVDGSTYNLL